MYSLIDWWTATKKLIHWPIYAQALSPKYRTFQVLLWVDFLITNFYLSRIVVVNSLRVCVCDATHTTSISSHKILKVCVWFPNAKQTKLSVVADGLLATNWRQSISQRTAHLSPNIERIQLNIIAGRDVLHHWDDLDIEIEMIRTTVGCKLKRFVLLKILQLYVLYQINYDVDWYKLVFQTWSIKFFNTYPLRLFLVNLVNKLKSVICYGNCNLISNEWVLKLFKWLRGKWSIFIAVYFFKHLTKYMFVMICST